MEQPPSVKPTWKSQEYFRSFRPQFSPCCFILLYAGVAVTLLPLGIAVLVTSGKVVEYTEHYSDCNTNICQVVFNVMEDMTKPVFLYYEITNMYMNHRLFVKSKDDKQLSGELRTRSELEVYCGDVLEVKDLWRGINSTSEQLANPCGLIANSLFNDTIRFEVPRIEMEKNGLSWYEDDERYQRLSSDWRTSQWTDVEAESFSIWMRASATSNNKKLYGRIPHDLTSGTYTLSVKNNYNISRKWGGGRRLILSTSSAFGGKNYLLGGLLIAVSGIAAIEFLVIIVCCRRPGKDNFFPQLHEHTDFSLASKPESEPPREDIQQEQEAMRGFSDNGPN